MTVRPVHGIDQVLHIIGISCNFKVDCIVESCRAESTVSPSWFARLCLNVDILGRIGLEAAHRFHISLLLYTCISGCLELSLPLLYVSITKARWSQRIDFFSALVILFLPLVCRLITSLLISLAEFLLRNEWSKRVDP